MARYYLYSLKIVKIIVYIWILFIFFSIFHFNEITTTSEGDLVIIAFFDGVRNIFTYAFFGLIYLIAIAFIQLTSFIFAINPDFMFNFLNQFMRNLLSLWFTFPSGTTPLLTEIPDLIMTEFSIFTADLYLFSFQILIILSTIYFIRSFLQNNTKNDMLAVGSLILMIVIPLIVFGFRDMLDLFHVSDPYLDSIPNPLDPLFSQIPIEDFFQFLASPVILLAIISYIYLELAFQINYTDTVTKPSFQRRDRLETQLQILESESHFVVANVDKIKEEAKKRKEELEIEGKESVNKFLMKLEERFSYVKEMIEKKKLEEEEKKLITAASKTRRLGSYVESLFREDPEARDTITARSATPKSQTLALSTLINFTSRLLVLILLSFVIIHPLWFFENVFNLPPAIIESVAMYSPEVVIVLLIPSG
ncbi:MAG: hypothetical protein EU533_00520 [Promethearchaeota archaeon]|nr:MAG: hypothetical protein EU533_00520 [Candidatus Lokiarchaeota archaeon]